MNNYEQPIKGYDGLEVYQNSYNSAIKVIKELLPKLPHCEKYDLVDQLRRSSKAIPRLIAEGYARRHQKAGFQKYLSDALGECNETEVGLKQCRDIYGIERKDLLDMYERTGKQIYRLSEVWSSIKKKNIPNTTQPNYPAKPTSQPQPDAQ